MHLNQAKAIADRIVEILSPHCTKIHIAGSIRREKPEVKDIEIVCEPVKQAVGLFSDVFIPSRHFKEAASTFIDTVEKGNFEGRYMKINLIGGRIQLDLFMPQSEDYYRQYAIRTGSSEYSKDVIAAGWIRKGWCGVDKLGLRRIIDCEAETSSDGKTTWSLVNPEAENPPVWKSEEEFFNWLEVPWKEPKLRL